MGAEKVGSSVPSPPNTIRPRHAFCSAEGYFFRLDDFRAKQRWLLSCPAALASLSLVLFLLALLSYFRWSMISHAHANCKTAEPLCPFGSAIPTAGEFFGERSGRRFPPDGRARVFFFFHLQRSTFRTPPAARRCLCRDRPLLPFPSRRSPSASVESSVENPAAAGRGHPAAFVYLHLCCAGKIAFGWMGGLGACPSIDRTGGDAWERK